MRNEKLILGCGRLRYAVPSAEIRIRKQSPVLPALVATERWRDPNAANLDGGEAMTGAWIDIDPEILDVVAHPTAARIEAAAVYVKNGGYWQKKMNSIETQVTAREEGKML